jgi:predicted esterase
MPYSPKSRDAANPVEISKWQQNESELGMSLGVKTFDDYQTEVFRLYLEKKYQDSLKVAMEAAKQFPDGAARTTFWIACLNSRLGKLDQALEALDEGLKKGAWWHEDTLSDADLDPIRGKPEFDRIKSESQHLKDRSAKVSKPDLLVMDPRISNTDPWPVLIVLHQRGGDRPSQTARQWSSVLQRGVGLAVPWSSQVYEPDRRCWDNLEIAEKDLMWMHSQLSKHKDIDLQKIIVAGFSQGAAVSIYVSLKRILTSKGFVAVAPSDWVVPEAQRAVERDRPSPAFTSFVQSSNAEGIRGCIFIGENDPFLKKIEFLKGEMVDRGLECKYSVELGIGHEYPRNFDERLAESVGFILHTTLLGQSRDPLVKI